MGDAADERETLLGLLEHADAVLLDFDGPVCDLFGDVSTAPVAREIKKAVRAVWDSDLGSDIERCDDSHGILRHVRDLYEGPPPVPPRLQEALRRAEDIVQRQEYAAIESARPAPDVTGLVTALRDMGMLLAIVSNNAPGPVESYLERKGLRWAFKKVIGRDPHEPRRMKPHPGSVERALESLGGLPPSSCVLIGDQITDLLAAKAAKTRFIGYTQSPERAAQMRERGAEAVVSSHAPLIGAAEALRKPN